ncbi:hypothetical protein D1BOALGB6SA_6913 [Olavius sp. associated proteobacterium Delta 1]|nr:hypothetical protein D1BOALGB6SA_6913 [Olavius sp. associated proteobacterium Delta 1]
MFIIRLPWKIIELSVEIIKLLSLECRNPERIERLIKIPKFKEYSAIS